MDEVNIISTTYTYKELVYIICNLPTAFDVEKVVSELEEWTFEADVIMPRGGIIKNNKLISSSNAIDIVRKGVAE